MRIVCVVGARPNFVKIAPLLAALEAKRASVPGLDVRLVHTGQHYDDAMSASFFADLGIRPPDADLGVGSGTHAEQTAGVLVGIERLLTRERPGALVVVGDVNSTLAATLAAVKLHVPVAHVEAGLRSFDRAMPEEINRILTDAVADLCFTTSREAGENLRREGVPDERIHFVGNVMIDALNANRARARRPAFLDERLERSRYALLTVHRPSNVDTREAAVALLGAIEPVRERMQVVFVVHPRTRERLEAYGLSGDMSPSRGMVISGPLPYLEFLYLMERAHVVLTDSGGVQEETTVLGVPCLTLRENTERPVTVEVGTNRVVGLDPAAIARALDEVAASGGRRPAMPELWDGHAATRIADVLVRWLDARGATAAT